MALVLVCNAGSSSLKLACYGPKEDAAPRYVLSVSGSADTLLKALQAYLAEHFVTQGSKPLAVLHRIVHVGTVDEGAIPLDENMMAKIRHWQVLAPLHNALALKIIDCIQDNFSETPQFAVCDSGLFKHLPRVASTYPLPLELSPQWPIQRYGFHGIAHRSQWKQVQAQSSGPYHKVITLQLGSGCSATAWLGDQVMDTSMGFTPLEGMPMVTRSGSIDPGIILHLMQGQGLSIEEVSQLLNKQSGLTGLAGNNDVIEVFRSDDEAARLARDIFCYQLGKQVAAYTFVLGGLDALSLGGGIAEHNPHIRQCLLESLSYMRVSVDADANARAKGFSRLHQKQSAIHAYLCPVDEMALMFDYFIRTKYDSIGEKD